ncbi:kinase-like domain-containing protein [Elsinoe ampelina]|uniref:non-specific serine/threonine protein kinase n=1 Tax=Elsinoe ampelina TaxID=302913 RepID=A0A6A6FYT7_9PEZI|nr:kinase-like domain-containing protein [Elsinoe ampelina]
MATIDYAGIQAGELEVLEAIHMGDYRELPIKSAWNKTSGRAFELKLSAEEDPNVVVTLTTTFTTTYPRTPPLIEVRGLEGLHERTQERIKRIATLRPAQLVKESAGEVIMHLVVEEVKDALDDAAQARATGVLPSLEDERALMVAAHQAQEEAAREAERKRQQEAKAEADRLLQENVEREVRRKAALQAPPTPAQEGVADAGLSADVVLFEEDMEMPVAADGAVATFKGVEILSRISKTANSEELLVRPGRHLFDAVLKLRRVSILPRNVPAIKSQTSAQEKPFDFMYHLTALERELKELKKHRHPHVNIVYAFRLDRQVIPGPDSQLGWSLSILSELSNRGSLDEMLEDGQTISLLRAREWSHSLLGALNFLHNNNIVHKQINPTNIRLYRSGDGLTMPQLSGTCYNHRLDILLGNAKASKPTHWCAPEARLKPLETTHAKIDIWDFGVVMAQMLFGKDIIYTYRTPQLLLQSMQLTSLFNDLIRKFFLVEQTKRPPAFDLLLSEFFRSTEAAVQPGKEGTAELTRQVSAVDLQRPSERTSRHNSSSISERVYPLRPSHFASEFTELARIGRGGFGEVVRVRNKVDNGLFAVKKIKSRSTRELEEIRKEVALLCMLTHPYIVRYHMAWVEDDFEAGTVMSDSTRSTASDFTGTALNDVEFVDDESAGSVDAGGQYFDRPDSAESDDDGSDEESGSPEESDDVDRSNLQDAALNEGDRTEASRLLRPSPPARLPDHAQILYIPMELCEGQTLRHLFARGMTSDPEKQWKMLRQILQGLEYIHSRGIIHRDFKPDNIFIDKDGNPRIGDFGLATTSHTAAPNVLSSSHGENTEMSRGMGTALYIAPELQKTSEAKYTNKVDMYSMGIIFFEMCFQLDTAMERDQEIRKIRAPQHSLPSAFDEPEKAEQKIVILSLITHNQAERPSSSELLQSSKLPASADEESLRITLQRLEKSDRKTYEKILTTLHTPNEDQRIKDMAWDATVTRDADAETTAIRLRQVSILRSVLEPVLRRHGAEELPQSMIYPRSTIYDDDLGVVSMLDRTGNLLQLPYDHTLPHARQLAKWAPVIPRTYTFGHVLRNTLGGPPKQIATLNFDIASKAGEDSVIYDAEAIKILDELVDNVPVMAEDNIAYHLNHANILNAILDHCKVEEVHRTPVKKTLSELGFNDRHWKHVREALRSPHIDVPSTTLDELSKFDFRQLVDEQFVLKTKNRLNALLANSPACLLQSLLALDHLYSVSATLAKFGFNRSLFFAPFASHDEAYYKNGIMFQVFVDKRIRKGFGAGGRYDSLVQSYRLPTTPPETLPRTVGFQLSLDYMTNKSLHHQKNVQTGSSKFKVDTPSYDPLWSSRRCEVLIFPAAPDLVNTICASLLSALWAADISAELASSSTDMDSIFFHQKQTTYGFIIKVNSETASAVRIRNTATDSDNKVNISEIVSHIRADLRDRDSALLKSRRLLPSLTRGLGIPELPQEQPIVTGRRGKKQRERSEGLRS